jgi:tRNA pseudouridine13 synthase
MDLPYLTPDLPGIGGVIKERPEDFFVQELPLYEPSGQGEHVYCEIQKISMSTFDAVDRMARALDVPRFNIGYAGMKDAQAVSRQLFSILGTSEQAVSELHIPGITVQWVARHGNKLRLGHLAGNRFAIKIRQVTPTDVLKVTPILEVLQKRGMPNYFGEQRFGRRGDNHLLGAAFIRGDNDLVLKLFLGSPRPDIDQPDGVRARTAFDARDLKTAMREYPRQSGVERRALHRLIQSSRPSAAIRTIDQRLTRLWVSALQSSLFNQVVAARIATLGQVVNGDLAYKHDNGAVFLVQDANVEEPRAEAFEISPTGPLLGYRMTMPEGEPLRIEQEVMGAAGIASGDLRASGRLKVKGARRALRARPSDVEVSAGVDEHGSHITVAFTLPSGSYATMVLRELMKGDRPEAEEESGEVEGEEESGSEREGDKR